MEMAFTHTMPHLIIPSPSKSTTYIYNIGLVSLIYLGWELLCVETISILSASFLCQSYNYYTYEFFHLLVSSLFVLSDVIVEDIVGLCTCTCTMSYKKAMVYYCFCCGMYEELFTNKL